MGNHTLFYSSIVDTQTLHFLMGNFLSAQRASARLDSTMWIVINIMRADRRSTSEFAFQRKWLPKNTRTLHECNINLVNKQICHSCAVLCWHVGGFESQCSHRISGWTIYECLTVYLYLCLGYFPKILSPNSHLIAPPNKQHSLTHAQCDCDIELQNAKSNLHNLLRYRREHINWDRMQYV